MALIEISNINKSYKKKTILKDISLSADSGDCIGIVGANGCGKSTLLKILAGAIPPTSGKILYDNNSPLLKNKFFSEYIAYVPQDNPLFDNLTVLDNLRLFYCESSHNLKNDLDHGILSDFQINQYVHQKVSLLSGGMKKRLSIACALIKDPKILILDEPGASLDIVCKSDIQNYMVNFITNGGTILIASHEEQELNICNKLFYMQNGDLNVLEHLSDLSSLIAPLQGILPQQNNNKSSLAHCSMEK